MANVGRIKIRSLNELQECPKNVIIKASSKNVDTPIHQELSSDSDFEVSNTQVRTTQKQPRKKLTPQKVKALTTGKKLQVSNQKLLSDYFHSCAKTYQNEPTAESPSASKKISAQKASKRKPRKRLFDGDLKPSNLGGAADVIDLCASTDGEIDDSAGAKNGNQQKADKAVGKAKRDVPQAKAKASTKRSPAKKAPPKNHSNKTKTRRKRKTEGESESSAQTSISNQRVLRTRQIKRFYIESDPSASESESVLQSVPSCAARKCAKPKADSIAAKQHNQIPPEVSNDDDFVAVVSQELNGMNDDVKAEKACASRSELKALNGDSGFDENQKPSTSSSKTLNSNLYTDLYFCNISSDTEEDELPLNRNLVEKENVESAGCPKTNATARKNTKAKTRAKRPKPPCPEYKVIKGTSFAVDAFRYGPIEGVTHYFLTHFHADHYIGLTRKFAMPLYMSPITARLVQTFIPIGEEYIHKLELYSPVTIDGIEVTAIDANHCPGAIMLVFKFPNGECTLHTGDFRASADMESEPIFWNNDIHRVYLDTTYLPSKYEMYSQSESFDRAREYISQFREEHFDCRVLYLVGAYLIGKERLWSYLAKEFHFKVWTEPKRKTALTAMEIDEYTDLLTDNPLEAQMHVVSMNTLNYQSLVQYLKQVESHFDIIFAIRPSGWEKKSRPQLRNKINIVGIEYSEHSAYHELERFIKYLKPKEVISTVPYGRDLSATPKVPPNWYKYESLAKLRNGYQPSITSFMKLRPGPPSAKDEQRQPHLSRIPNTDGSVSCGDVNTMTLLVSPLKDITATEKSRNETSYECPNANNHVRGDLDLVDDNDWMS